MFTILGFKRSIRLAMTRSGVKWTTGRVGARLASCAACLGLTISAGCATVPDLPPLPDNSTATVSSRSFAPEQLVGPPPAGLAIAWRGEPGRSYYIEAMNRANPNEWAIVATGLTVDANGDGVWRSGGEGCFRCGVE